MELPIFYDQAEEWNRAIFLYDSALKEINTKLEILNNEFKLAHQYNPIEHITSRIKSPQSIAKKIRHNDMELTVENIIKYVNDVAGIRIICSFTSDIYRIADLITEQSDVKVLKIKDYIINPKENGYMSYHMIVSIPVFLSDQVIDTKVEIQIRTIAMDFWASLEHKMYYKFEGNAPTHIRRELKECADIVSFLDQKMLALNDEIRTYSVDPLDEYREMMSDMFQSRMKEAYGTIACEGEAVKARTQIVTNEAVKARAQIATTEPDVIEADAVIDSEMITAIQEKAKKEEALVNNMKNSEKSEKVSFTASLFGRKKAHNKAAN